MSQNVVDYSLNPTGPELLDDYLDKEQKNNLTSNSGIQRPSYAQAGTPWLDISTTPWTWYLYDGISDIAIGTFNPTTHEFISVNFANVVNLTTAQSIAGVKTFTNKPLVPTPTSTDNTATVANLAYVAGIQQGLQTAISNLETVVNGKAGLSASNVFTGTNTFVTPSVSDNSQKPATTAYINTKFQKVNSLPASPDADTWYGIPEE